MCPAAVSALPELREPRSKVVFGSGNTGGSYPGRNCRWKEQRDEVSPEKKTRKGRLASKAENTQKELTKEVVRMRDFIPS